MKYALVNGQRQEAQPGLSGDCPACGSLMVARCGDVRVNHWAHRGRRNCDPWWENETEWHRAWKEMFPKDWQERVNHAESGEKHIADVKTDQGWVLEFQHSNIHPDERKAREAFYQKLIWIVDGARRKRDKSQFFKAWEDGRLVFEKLNLRRISFPDECALLREWAGSRTPVFFDFSGHNKPEDAQLWCLIRVIDGMAYVGPFPRAKLIKYHSPEATKMDLDFAGLLKNLHVIVGEIARQPQHGPSNPLRGFQRYQERRRRHRRRF